MDSNGGLAESGYTDEATQRRQSVVHAVEDEKNNYEAITVVVEHSESSSNSEDLLPSPPSEDELEEVWDVETVYLEAEEDDLLEEGTMFRHTCRFVARIGLAAHTNGSPAFRVEAFMKALMQNFGYDGIFRISNTELFSAFQETEESDQLISLIEIEPEEPNLYRLGKISDIVKAVLQRHLTRSQAIVELREVENGDDPFGKPMVFATFIVVGGGLTAVFRGSWDDMLVASICSIPVFLLTNSLPRSFKKALPFLSSIIVALMAALTRQYLMPTVHAGIVVVSSIAIILPGYDASLAVSELLSHHITAGFDRLLHALTDLVLFVVGAWLGGSLLEGLGEFPSCYDETRDDSIPLEWLGLIGPLLILSLCVAFQTALEDFGWALLNLSVAFATAISGSLMKSAEAGVFLAALLVTINAQLWAKWKDRPRSILLVPSLVLLVSGSIGFRGLVNWTEGCKDVGVEQFLQMFIVALLIIAGVLVGSVLVPPNTTL